MRGLSLSAAVCHGRALLPAAVVSMYTRQTITLDLYTLVTTMVAHGLSHIAILSNGKV